MTLINPNPDRERRRKGNRRSPRISTSLEHERKNPPRNMSKSHPAMDYTAPKHSMPLPGGFASGAADRFSILKIKDCNSRLWAKNQHMT